MTDNIFSLESKRYETPGQALNTAIRLRTKTISFSNYQDFLKCAICPERPAPESAACQEFKQENVDANISKKITEAGLDKKSDTDRCFKGVHSYDSLKAATELFLMLYACSSVRIDITREQPNALDTVRLDGDFENEKKRLGWEIDTPADLMDKLKNLVDQYFDGNPQLPYLKRILNNLNLQTGLKSIFCDDSNLVIDNRVNNPCMIELIWSYWHEEGMLAQAINAISLRFQNKKMSSRDPLANLTLSPLRPLSNLLWGYIQDEHNRLSMQRRAYEYDHEYGLTLIGKAVPVLQTADSRSKFIEAFHNLLNRCMIFFKEENNKLMVPDPFPLLNALKEVHMLLAEGAHNQFGDLPFQARVEMLMQQWLLSRPEMHEFLGRRPMMPYREGWMSAVDALKTIQGWTDVSAMHFSDLGVFGEQILLSIRYGDWNNVNDAEEARNWALYWRSEIQSYAHAYRIATGVDLANPVVNGKVDATKPSVHLSRRLEMQLQRR